MMVKPQIRLALATLAVVTLGGCSMFTNQLDTSAVEAAVVEAVPQYSAHVEVQATSSGFGDVLLVVVAAGGETVGEDDLRGVCTAVVESAGNEWVGVVRILFTSSEFPDGSGELQDLGAAMAALGVPRNMDLGHGLEGSVPELRNVC